jgi:endonuclease V-like protein UPF0215 family
LLKKQARLLGLSITRRSKGELIAVGVVFRGSSWLDGTLSCTINLTKRNHWSNLSRAVAKSRQYSQLHAVILSQTTLRSVVNVAELSARLKLPVIAITTRYRPSTFTKSQLGTKNYKLLVNGKRISVLAKGVTLDKAQEIFNVGCKPNSFLPEATRVADLIAKHALG